MTRVSGEREQPVPPMDTTPAVGVFPEKLWTLMPVIVEGGLPTSPRGQSKVSRTYQLRLRHCSRSCIGPLGREPSSQTVICNEITAWRGRRWKAFDVWKVGAIQRFRHHQQTTRTSLTFLVLELWPRTPSCSSSADPARPPEPPEVKQQS